jgi:hypothetical protein
MKICLVSLALVAAAMSVPAAMPLQTTDDLQALRSRIESRYDVIPITDGVALRPKSRLRDVRLIEVTDTIAINGVVVTGAELRDRIGADADAIVKLSYQDAGTRRRLFAAQAPRAEPDPALEAPRSPSPAPPPDPGDWRWNRRSRGDRIRILGDVTVREDEAISGQVVAVIGSVYIDGEVGDQVVAVLGSVNLGPKAVVRGDIVSVGGRIHRTPGAQVRGGQTEVALSNVDIDLDWVPWFGTAGFLSLFDGFSAVPRLIATAFRLGLLLVLAWLAVVVARGSVESSAQRISDNPLKATLIGIVSVILLPPVLFLVSLGIAITIIGIPLLLLLPFVILALVVMALVGFTGAAIALGQAVRRRFGMWSASPFADVAIGIVVILLPLLVGRVIALAGWAAGPAVFLFVALGAAVEFLAWSCGFGAIVTNAITRWEARRAARTPLATPNA